MSPKSGSSSAWRFFSDLDLSEAKKSHFSSMHDCFIRELKDGARPIDSRIDVVVSPCDAIVGACGKITGTEVLQIKGFRYELQELLHDHDLVERHRNGLYVTLRLSAGMYHRFHAPHDCRVDEVVYIPGDVWNVNPMTLRRVEKLFCKNERAILQLTLASAAHRLTLVPVAAVLVAGIRLSFFDGSLRSGPDGTNRFVCKTDLKNGEQMGWFEHGSTILVFAPDGFSLCENVREGALIRAGQPLMRLP